MKTDSHRMQSRPAAAGFDLFATLSAICLTAFFAGCEGSTSAPMQTSSSPTSSKPAVPPTASLSGVRTVSHTETAAFPAQKEAEAGDEADAVDDGQKVQISELAEGSPEWLVREIARLRSLPVDLVRQPVPGEPNKFETVRLTAEQAQQEQHRRHEKIIELAQEAIQKSATDPAKEQLFNNAVHCMADARLQLSLAGDPEQAQLLNEDAEFLYQRNATSFAAVESALKVVQLTQQLAQREAAKDRQYAQAFARQARLFAEKFPQESSRAAINLMTAARMCDEFGASQDAEICLTMVEDKFAGSPFAEQVAPMLRRLRLPGQKLTEFGGSTADGGYIDIEQYNGRALLVVFWASNSMTFREQLPAIQQAQQRFGDRFAVVGVNFDRDERAIDQFLEETGIGWKQIFYSDPDKRGPRNLVARHYGVTQVPSYWLVDSQGIVRSVHVDPANLDAAVAAVIEGTN